MYSIELKFYVLLYLNIRTIRKLFVNMLEYDYIIVYQQCIHDIIFFIEFCHKIFIVDQTINLLKSCCIFFYCIFENNSVIQMFLLIEQLIWLINN